MENDAPMSTGTKVLFTIILSAIALSWSVSLISMLRQIKIGYAFKMDENGIHSTLTAVMIFAFIFVIPVKEIPYSAIDKVEEENKTIVLHMDKKQVKSYPFFNLFVRNQYRFFGGFTTVNKSDIQKILDLVKTAKKIN